MDGSKKDTNILTRESKKVRELYSKAPKSLRIVGRGTSIIDLEDIINDDRVKEMFESAKQIKVLE